MKQLLFKRKAKFIIYFIACFFPMITDLLRFGVVALIFDAIEKKDLAYFRNIIWITIEFIIYSFISYVASRLMRISYMRDTILDVRISAFDKIINMSNKSFNKTTKDVYTSNLINDVNNFEKNFFINLLNFIYSSSSYLVSMVIILLLDFKLGLIVIGISIIIFILTKLLENKTTSLHKEVSKNNEEYTTNLTNTLNGLEILKLNNIESKFLDNNLKAIDKVERSKAKFTFFSNSQMTIVGVLGSITFIVILVYLITQIQYGVSYSDIALIVMLSSNMTFGLRNIFPRINIIKSSKTIYDKITTPIIEESDVYKVNPFNFNNEIIIKDLDFNYENKVIFDKANCIIQKNKKYLIKGTSGAGKSTLVKILSNNIDTYEGSITVDGIELNTINEDSFNKDVAFIYQDVFLFEDSLQNNITLYKNINEEKINKAINLSGLTDFVEEKTLGIHEQISENGKNLSGGQRQRVSIARAIAKDAKILFVDEGTSSLNMELGKQIEQTFLDYNGTVLSISHRYYDGISNKYDYVLEINNGKINTYDAKEYFLEDVLYV